MPARTFLLVFVLAGELTRALAQQPFFTDDADVTPPRKFHLEIFSEYDLLQRSSFPNLRQNTASLRLNIGLLKDLEIGIDAPLLAIFNAPGVQPRVPVGFGDTNIALKYNFHKEHSGSPVPALTVVANFEAPTGDTARQLGSGVADYWLFGVTQKTLAPGWIWRVNTGIIFSGNTLTGVEGIKARGRVLTVGSSLVRNITPRLDLGIEGTGAYAAVLELQKQQLQLQVAGKYRVSRRVAFDFGVVGGVFQASPRIGAQIGVSVDF